MSFERLDRLPVFPLPARSSAGTGRRRGPGWSGYLATHPVLIGSLRRTPRSECRGEGFTAASQLQLGYVRLERLFEPHHSVGHGALDLVPLRLVPVSASVDDLPDAAGPLALQALPLQRLTEVLLDGIPGLGERVEDRLVLLVSVLAPVDVKLDRPLMLADDVIEPESAFS